MRKIILSLVVAVMTVGLFPQVSLAANVSIVTESIPQTTAGTGLAFQLQGAGGTGSYTWTLIYAEGDHSLTVSPSGYFISTSPKAGLWHRLPLWCEFVLIRHS